MADMTSTNGKIQAALEARKKRIASAVTGSAADGLNSKNEAHEAKIQSALSARQTRVKNSLPSVFSDIQNRFDSEIVLYNNTKPAFGAYDETYKSQRERRLSLSDLRNKVNAYRVYMGDSTADSMISSLGQIESGYDDLLRLSQSFDSEEDYNATKQRIQNAVTYGEKMADAVGKEDEILAGMTPTQRMHHINSGGFVDPETPWSDQVSYATTLIQIGKDEGYELTDRLLKQLKAQQKSVTMNDLTYENESSELQGYYNELITAKHTDLLSKTKMDGTNRSVLDEIQLLVELDSGKEKRARKEAVLKKMEELGIPADDYALFSDDSNFNWDTLGKWAKASAAAGVEAFNKGMTATANLILGTPLQAVGWKNNPFALASEYSEGRYNMHKFNQNLYAERLGDGAGWQYGGDFIEGTIGAVPQALLTFLTAGGSQTADLATKAAYETGNILTKAGLTVEAMMKNPSYWLSFGRAYGTDYEEAMQMGVSEPVAVLGATITSLLNAGIEVGIDGGSGIQGLSADLASGDKKKLWAWIESWAEEGGEEGLQKFVNEAVTKIMYDSDADILNPVDYARDMSLGTLSAAALGGGRVSINNVDQQGYTVAVDTGFQNYYDSIIQMEGDLYGEGQDYIWSVDNRGNQTDTYPRAGRSPEADAERPGIQEAVGETGKGSAEIHFPGGQHRGLTASGEDFDAHDYVEIDKNTDLGRIQQTLEHNGIECRVVRGDSWKRAAPAYAHNGRVYISQNIDQETLPTVIPHETTHVMKQHSFEGYIAFIEKVPDCLQMQTRSARRLLNETAKHRGVDISEMSDTDFINLYDELNAIVYGMHQGGILDDPRYDYGEWIPGAFKDFDGYIRRMDAIHAAFRQQNGAARTDPSGEDVSEVWAPGPQPTSREALAWVLENTDLETIEPRLRSKLRDYGRQLQQLRTVESMQQTQWEKIESLQSAGTDASTLQTTRRDLIKLQQLQQRQLQRLDKLEQKSQLQQLAQQTPSQASLNGTTEAEYIGKSVGAKSKNYKAYNPITGERMPLTEGTHITQPKDHIIAGKGRQRQIDQLDFLLDTYGGTALEWTKEKGFGYVDDEYGESHYVELHWCQEPTVGKVRMKIKVQSDGRIYLEED